MLTLIKFKLLEVADEDCQCVCEYEDWNAMVVANLSLSGLRFKTTGPEDIKIGHRLNLRFTLDDQQANKIEKEVRDIFIQDEDYGCEFLNLAYQEKELGYYLFSR